MIEIQEEQYKYTLFSAFDLIQKVIVLFCICSWCHHVQTFIILHHDADKFWCPPWNPVHTHHASVCATGSCFQRSDLW